MFHTIYKAYVIAANGTQIVHEICYNGESLNGAIDIFNRCVSSLDSCWHVFSPRDRATVTVMSDGQEIMFRQFGG